MVFLSVCLRTTNSTKRTFVDNVRVYVRGGGGGQGLPRYGGIGGRGGNVYVTATERASLKATLKDPNGRRYIGGAGQNSKVMALQGPVGNDMEIPVPPGVEIQNEAGRILGEVNEVGDRVLVGRGGVGGGPANNFYGQRSHAMNVRLNLKLIADVGLVGFPNAGKSTLLAALSRAAPKIASYAFTTIEPQVGKIIYPDQRQVSMADLPGLIEGAHMNIGLGYRFLKHVERTKMLLFVVDLHGFHLSPRHPHRSAIDTILLLNKELERYKPELLTKPCMLVLNKCDVDHPDIDVAEVSQQAGRLGASSEHGLTPDLLPDTYLTFDQVLCISAKRRVATESVKDKIRVLLDVYADRARGEAGQRALQTVGRGEGEVGSGEVQDQGYTGTILV